MGASIRTTGRGLLAAAVVAGLAGLAGLGVAVPAMASSRTAAGAGLFSPARTAPGAAQTAVIRASAIRAGAARASGQAVPGFASGVFPPAWAELGRISCPAASFCVAIGRYVNPLRVDPATHPLAEKWNGRSWRVIPGALGGATVVSCTSTRFCMAVGATTIERWDGRRWTAARTPSDLTDPTGVSCVRASFCMAVGMSSHVTNGGLAGCMTGAVWRGGTWHTVAIPFGGCAAERDLGPVSCASPSDCMAVGFQDGVDHTLLNLALGWNGKKWRALNTPPGGVDSLLSGVSCPSTSLCVAVGATFDGNLAVAWDGSAWTDLNAPPGRVDSELFGVWCTSADSCLAVGGDQAMTWNGTAWTSRAVSQPEGASLSDVSCWHPSACMAAGSSTRIALPEPQRDEAGAQLTLAEEWNGSTWQALRTPTPGDEQEGLSGVSCRSAANCTAVGAFVNRSDTQAALAERWNGRTWQVLATPDPGPNENALTAVSCPAASQCIAVGYFDAAGDDQALAEQWNGSTWTTLVVPHNGVLTGVSCPAVNDCMAVGSYAGGHGPQPLSVTWDGSSTWTLQASPSSAGSRAAFTAVACPSRTRCIAVGDKTTEGNLLPLTALWNGTAWTTLTTPAPGGADNSLTSVSCSRPQNCMAVGRTFLSGRLSHALAESWDGRRWTVRPTPKLKIDITHLNAVSCPKPTRCRAVGGYLTSSGTGFVLAEAWNGATWRRLVPITDPSLVFNDLYAISCPAALHCIAVGGTDTQRTLAYLWNGTRWQRLRTPTP